MTEEKKMNLLPFAITGMVHTPASGGDAKGKGGGSGGVPPGEVAIAIEVDAASGKPSVGGNYKLR